MTIWHDRFDAKVAPEPMSGCWLWMENVDTSGYAQFSIKGKNRGAHRLSYERHRGEIPAGLQIDHLCRVRSCVNPDHMEMVTQQENMRRGIPRCAKITHCPKGHAYDAQNTWIDKTGRRHCRECRTTSSRETYLRNRGKIRSDYYAKKAAKWLE